MTTAIRQKVVVQPGGVIKIQSPELHSGAAAEVIVLLESQQPARKLSALIGSGKGSFENAKEADLFLQKERDSWES